jgi:hypothetical protein
LGLMRHITPLIFAFRGRSAVLNGPATSPCLTQVAIASVTCAPYSIALEAFVLCVGFLAGPRQPMSALFSKSLQTAFSLSLSAQPTALAQDLNLTGETVDFPLVFLLDGNLSQNWSSAGVL